MAREHKHNHKSGKWKYKTLKRKATLRNSNIKYLLHSSPEVAYYYYFPFAELYSDDLGARDH